MEVAAGACPTAAVVVAVAVGCSAGADRRYRAGGAAARARPRTRARRLGRKARALHHPRALPRAHRPPPPHQEGARVHQEPRLGMGLSAQADFIRFINHNPLS
ncbi:Protein of unknown function [Gryllus bimaculatus]|nr:Protein of unknown function [Gryllus bimaculatus]